MSNSNKESSLSIAGRGLRLAMLTFVAAVLLAAPSQAAARSALWLSLPLLIVIISIGVVADMVGVAAALAKEAPFNAMAAKKVPGARQGLRIIRNVGTVSSFLSDFIGDIVGTLTGAFGAAIVFGLTPLGNVGLAESLAVATVAALTVGGKGIGKHIAVHKATEIVLKAGQALYWVEGKFGITILPDRNQHRKGK